MLSIVNLTKIYKTKGGADTVALDDLNVDFPETGMIFLLGKSGSGKSTLLNVAGGLDYPTSGEIILKGRSSKDFSQSDFDSYRNTYIGFIFQEYNVLNEFNVEQNIALALELQGKKASREAVDDLLEQVDLQGFGKRKPNTLSGGQKQRLAIARALIKEPNIIMADEPTGALDSKTGEQVFETLKKLSSDKLVIVVSHDRDFAERFADRIIELKDGRIISDQSKKHVEAKRISSNVTIINERAIKINDAKSLTKEDFDQLYLAIKNTSGNVFISSGENAVKSMKVSHINENGQSDEFIQTENVELQEYDGYDTNFIRSKMPIGKSIKMGLSSLKTKPVRLFFTIFLSVISFTMFGIASSLMLYNSSHTYSEALSKTDYLAEKLEKNVKGYYVNQEIDDYGRVIRENKYESTMTYNFGPEEIDKLNDNNLDLVYIPIGSLNTNLSINNLNMKKDSEFYREYYRIRYLSDTTKENFDKLGYKLDGAYPANDDEILLPKIYGEMLIDSEAINKPSYLNLIGDTYQFVLSKGLKDMKICGFFDAGEIPERYMELKKGQESALSPSDLADLRNELPSFIQGSFNCVAFTSSAVFDENVSKSNSYTYVEMYERLGLRISTQDYDYKVTADEWFNTYTDETVKNYPNEFELYDLDGNAVDTRSFALQENEIYISEQLHQELAFGMRRSLLEYFFYMKPTDDSFSNPMRFMPEYYEYYNNNSSAIQAASYNIWEDDSLAMSILNQFKDEFKKAYKIVNQISEFKNSEYYGNTLSASDRDLIDNAFASEMGTNTKETVNSVYSILENHFDEACPNYFYKKYFTTLYENSEKARRAIEESDTLQYLLYNTSYKEWTNAEVNTVKDFIESYNPSDFDYVVFMNVFSGYTFATYNPVSDQVFNAIDIVLYYRDYAENSGVLNVAGYYPDDRGYTYILNKDFVDAHSLNYRNGGYTYRYFFETEYVAEPSAKYSNAMVKTDYTQSQITYMHKGTDANVSYRLTSNKYYTISFIVEMIGYLKNLFFWFGVGFGVFSALMLLNFITVSVASKKRDIGILRAIGARKIDVFKIFFSESLFIAALCSLIAIIGTYVAQFFLDNYFVTQIGISILQFNILTVTLIFAIAVTISFVATLIPVGNASRKPPVESIRAL